MSDFILNYTAQEYEFTLNYEGDTFGLVTQLNVVSGGAVDSVNGQTGVVELFQKDIQGIAKDDLSVSGDINIDFDDFDVKALILFGDANISQVNMTNLPEVGFSKEVDLSVFPLGNDLIFSFTSFNYFFGKIDPNENNQIKIIVSNTTNFGLVFTIIIINNNLKGKAIYNASLSGTITPDLNAFDSYYGILTGNTTIGFLSNSPVIGETVVKTLEWKSTAGETLTFPSSWNIFGEYDNSGVLNVITLNISNYPTVGLKVNTFINQPS